VASALLTVYGGLNVLLGTLVLSGVIHPAGSVDRTALRWHAGVWDLWFLVWGILLAVATIAYWRRTARRAYAEGVPRYYSGATMGAIAQFFAPFHPRRVVSLVRDRGTDSPTDEEIKREAAAEVERVEQDDKYFAPETPADRDDLLSPGPGLPGNAGSIFQISGRGIGVACGYASSRMRTIPQGFTSLSGISAPAYDGVADGGPDAFRIGTSSRLAGHRRYSRRTTRRLRASRRLQQCQHDRSNDPGWPAQLRRRGPAH
jgi:hypothetical protein